MSKPTSRPWTAHNHVDGRYGAHISHDFDRDDGIGGTQTIAVTLTYRGRENSQADASLIVRAVNTHDRFRLIRHILDVPAHKLNDVEYLRACVVNARTQAECALRGEPISDGERSFIPEE